MTEHLYVCEFSTGAIKVGRSSRPASRIAAHRDRVACAGVTLTRKFITTETTQAVAAEALLITTCLHAGARRRAREWMYDILFETVCDLASAACIAELPVTRAQLMTDAELISSLGGPTKVATLLGYEKHGPQRVQNWLVRGIPAHVKVARPDLFMAGAVRASESQAAA